MSENNDDLSSIEDDLEIIEESENVERQEPTDPIEGANAEQNDDSTVPPDEPDKKEVKVKRVRNPQPKLDVERLRGPRGLKVLEDTFRNVPFKGRGHEEADLVLLMKTYEYWCHRLFPKFPFNDCLERMERLGSKKFLQTYVKKMRMGLIDDDEIPAPQQNDNDEEIDEEDAPEDVEDTAFNALLPPQSTQPIGLTDEQLRRIEMNREKAERIRKQMQIRNKENVDISNRQISETSHPSTSSNTDFVTEQLFENSILTEHTNNDPILTNISIDSEIARLNFTTNKDKNNSENTITNDVFTEIGLNSNDLSTESQPVSSSNAVTSQTLGVSALHEGNRESNSENDDIQSMSGKYNETSISQLDNSSQESCTNTFQVENLNYKSSDISIKIVDPNIMSVDSELISISQCPNERMPVDRLSQGCENKVNEDEQDVIINNSDMDID